MEMTVDNPQKGRLETIDATINDENTTWFENCENNRDIHKITDFEGDLLISEFGHAYPLRIYNMSRADISLYQKKTRELRDLYLEGEPGSGEQSGVR